MHLATATVADEWVVGNGQGSQISGVRLPGDKRMRGSLHIDIVPDGDNSGVEIDEMYAKKIRNGTTNGHLARARSNAVRQASFQAGGGSIRRVS